MRYSKKRLKELWGELGFVMVDTGCAGQLVLDEDWLMFERGTDIEDVWRWFDKEYEGGVDALMSRE